MKAKEEALKQKKWLLINLQNMSEFVCQTLNRDLWSDRSVKDVIKEQFIFLQVTFILSKNGRGGIANSHSVKCLETRGTALFTILSC
jgi:thioredoxin-related protein